MGVSVPDMDGLSNTDRYSHDNSLSDADLLQLSAFGASALTRTCSRRAFEKKGRALQAIDLSVEVPDAFEELYGGDEPKL